MRELFCPAWCENDHELEFGSPEFPGLSHRSRPVEVPSENPGLPFFGWAEGWVDGDGRWGEAVSIGRRGEDAVQLSAGAAVRFGLGLVERARLLPTLVDDPAALRLALGTRAPAGGGGPLAVTVRRVGATSSDRTAEVRYRDGDALVIDVQESHVSAEAASHLEVLLRGLLAGNGPDGGAGG